MNIISNDIKMIVIDRIEPEKQKCRHCIKNIDSARPLWYIFFNQFNKNTSLWAHRSTTPSWMILQPYNFNKIKDDDKIPIKYAEEHGVNVALIEKGYHHESTSTVIFYPENKELFIETVKNNYNNMSLKYEEYVKYIKKLDKKGYNPSKPEECLQAAFDFLTWKS